MIYGLGFVAGVVTVGGCLLADNINDTPVLFIGAAVANGAFLALTIIVAYILEQRS